MQKSNSKFYIVIFGALLIIAGLFFFRGSSNEAGTAVSESDEEARPLKPSEVDFSKSNHPEAASAPVIAEHPKLDLQTPQGFSEAETKQWTVFQEVVNSRDDNDPRIDQELRNLSPRMHENLRKTYQQLPMESRNSRGLIAFLIARDLQSVQDAEFLKGIYEEEPCRSMSDCTKAEASDPHADATNQTSLNYPQLAGLYQLEQRLEKNPEILNNPEMRQEISALLREARQFPGSALQARAEGIQKKYGL